MVSLLICLPVPYFIQTEAAMKLSDTLWNRGKLRSPVTNIDHEGTHTWKVSSTHDLPTLPPQKIYTEALFSWLSLINSTTVRPQQSGRINSDILVK